MIFLNLYSKVNCCLPDTSILIVGFLCILGVNPVQAADECHFDEKESIYCHYGCCRDKCCPMTKPALIGLIVSTVVGLTSLMGCMFCLYCIFKTHGNPDKNDAMVHPVNDYNSKIYYHDPATDDKRSNVSSVGFESGIPDEQYNSSFSFSDQQKESK